MFNMVRRRFVGKLIHLSKVPKTVSLLKKIPHFLGRVKLSKLHNRCVDELVDDPAFGCIPTLSLSMDVSSISLLLLFGCFLTLVYVVITCDLLKNCAWLCIYGNNGDWPSRMTRKLENVIDRWIVNKHDARKQK